MKSLVGLCLAATLVSACAADSSPAESTRLAITAESCEASAVDGKVDICHATSSATHPFNNISVSSHACADHSGHAGDYIADGDSTCSGESPAPAGPIESIMYGGSGCPNGSVGKSISTERDSFTLIFDRNIASTGPGVPIQDSRKNCQINIELDTPPGFTWQVTLDYRGFFHLESGLKGSQKNEYHLDGSEPIALEKSFHGTKPTDYLNRDELDESTFVSPSCAGGPSTIYINSQIRIVGPSTSRGQLMLDSIDGAFTLVPCP